jgi:Bacteriophage tail sheath protein
MPTTYLAPGVYVEEVPSAQQPIAGVGTNTVGFLGIVPDVIKYPVPNDWYDPHLAEIIQRGEGATKEEKEAHAEAVKQLEALITEAKKDKKETEDATNKIKSLEANKKKLQDDFDSRTAEVAKLGDPQQKEKETKKLDKDKTQLDKDLRAIDLQVEEERKRLTEGITRDDFLKPYRMETFRVTRALDAKLCTNFTEYTDRFGPYSADDPSKSTSQALHPGHRALTHAVAGFFKNGGTRCFVVRSSSDNAKDLEKAFQQFESIDEVAIIAAPGLTGRGIWNQLTTHCEEMKDRFAILDPADVVGTEEEFDVKLLNYSATPSEFMPDRNRNAAYYFPQIEVIDPARQLQDRDPARGVAAKDRGKVYVPPSGHIAGVYARVDVERGVHKAPANEALLGVNDVKYYVGTRKQDLLNPQGVNCIRNMNGSIRVYGARTVGGDKNGEFKYISVRRVLLFLKESIDEGTQWVVFEPNDPSLWAKIRLNVSAFLTNVWRSGALFGITPQQAFYVKCDEETNPPEVRDLGQVITEIGVAIVRPAEFVIFRVTQWSGPTKS